MKALIVKAPYVTVRVADTPTGKPTMYGFYAGAVLPPSSDPENVAMLLRKGMVEEISEVAEAPAEKSEPRVEVKTKAPKA
ncbi:MAG TPA: hypothetical protein VF163_21090 [Micromonosporaceae bacterium]